MVNDKDALVGPDDDAVVDDSLSPEDQPNERRRQATPDTPLLEESDDGSNEEVDTGIVPLANASPAVLAVTSPNWKAFCEDYIGISRKSFWMMLSYDFSLYITLLLIIIPALTNDPDQIAAASLCAALTNSLGIIFGYPHLSEIILGSQFYGAKKSELEKPHQDRMAIAKHEEMQAAIFSRGTRIGLGAAIIPTLVMFFAEPILHHVFRQSSEVSRLIGEFGFYYGFAMPALIVLRIPLEMLYISCEETPYAGYAAMFSLAITVVMAVLFARGDAYEHWRGLPGIGVAYLIGTYLTTLLFTLRALLHPKFNVLKLWDLSRQFGHDTVKGLYHTLLSIGIPMMLIQANEVLLSAAISYTAGAISAADQAAVGYALQVLFILFLPINTAAFASTQYLSMYKGEENYAQAQRIARNTVLIAMINVLPITLPLVIHPRFFLNWFSCSESAVCDKASNLIRILAAGGFFEAIRSVFRNQLNAVGELYEPLGKSLITLWGSMVIGIIIASTTEDVHALAAAFLVGVIVCDLALYQKWYQRTDAATMKARSDVPPEAPSLKTMFGWMRWGHKTAEVRYPIVAANAPNVFNEQDEESHLPAGEGSINLDGRGGAFSPVGLGT